MMGGDRVALNLTRGRGVEAARRAEEADARARVLESRVRVLTEELNARSGYRRIVGTSSSWRRALTEATQVATTETTVLLTVEETLAALQKASSIAYKPPGASGGSQ